MLSLRDLLINLTLFLNMLTTPISKNIDISYNIETVKKALNYLLDNHLKSGYNASSRNDNFNTYQFAKLKGLGGGNIGLELKKIDENYTNLNISVTVLLGSGKYYDASHLSQIINNFLNDLSNSIINWDSIQIEKKNKEKFSKERKIIKQELKQNNPMLYYFKILLALIPFIVIIGGLLFFIYWILNLKK